MTLTELVARERARVGRLFGVAAVAVVLACLSGVLAAGTCVLGGGRWMRLPPVLPWLAWGVAGVGVLIVMWLAWRWLRHTTADARIAGTIELERGLRQGAVQGAMEVGAASVLGQHGAQAVTARLASTTGPLAPALYRRVWQSMAATLVVAVVMGAALRTAVTTHADGWRAVRHPVQAWRGTLLPRLELRAPAHAPRGQVVRVRIIAPGRREIVFAQRVTGAPWTSTSLPVVRDTAVVSTIPVDADLSLVATDGRAVSDTLLVQASDRPFVGSVALQAQFPAYLHRAAEALPASELIRVPRGTVIEITGHASTPLQRIVLVRGPQGSDTLALHAHAQDFSGQVSAELPRSGQWRWDAAGRTGPIADVPQPLDLDVIPDSAPTIEIVAPLHDTVVGPDDQFSLSIAATDDHGLADVAIRSWRVHGNRTSSASEVVQHVQTASAARWAGDVALDLSTRGLVPGDAMHIVAEATDNSPWQQRATSRELVLRVPSLVEQRLLAAIAADSMIARASATATAEKQLAQRTEEAAEARGARSSSGDASGRSSNPSGARGALSYESAEKAKALGAEQQAMSARVDSLRQQAGHLEQQLRQAGALDSGVASRLAEAQQLLRDALTPELQQQLDQLNQAATALNAGQTRQSLSDLAQQQQQMRTQLDRTVDLLKRAALEGALQTAHDEAHDIANAERAQARAPSAPAQEQLAARARALSNRMEQLAGRLSAEQAETGAKQVEGARAPMDSSAQAISRGRATPAAGAMDRAAQQLADARQAQVSEWKSSLTNDLDRSVQETMQLAQQEQSLAQTARQSGADRTDLAAQQSAVQQGVQRTGERLQKAARQSALVSPQAQAALGQAEASVQRATAAARSTQPGGAGPEETATAMRDAAGALTAAAGALAHDRAQAAGASSASGLSEMLQQLQQMAQQQGQLNAQAGGVSALPGGAQGSAAKDAVQSLAEQERTLADGLDKVGHGPGGGSGADALAREARQIADALERSGLDPGTIVRQQRLYHRLLDAGHTLEKDEQDSSGKRVAQAATGREQYLPTNTVARGAAAEPFPEPTWVDLRSLTADERQMVLDYFKRINASQSTKRSASDAHN